MCGQLDDRVGPRGATISESKYRTVTILVRLKPYSRCSSELSVDSFSSGVRCLPRNLLLSTSVRPTAPLSKNQTYCLNVRSREPAGVPVCNQPQSAFTDQSVDVP